MRFFGTTVKGLVPSKVTADASVARSHVRHVPACAIITGVHPAHNECVPSVEALTKVDTASVGHDASDQTSSLRSVAPTVS